MSEQDVFARAWAMLIERIDAKTSWGKNELSHLMLKCIIDAGKDSGMQPAERIQT